MEGLLKAVSEQAAFLLEVSDVLSELDWWVVPRCFSCAEAQAFVSLVFLRSRMPF